MQEPRASKCVAIYLNSFLDDHPNIPNRKITITFVQ